MPPPISPSLTSPINPQQSVSSPSQGASSKGQSPGSPASKAARDNFVTGASEKKGHGAPVGSPKLPPPQPSLWRRVFGEGTPSKNSWATTMSPALRDRDYRALFTAKMCNQVGSGMAYGSYASLLQQVGIKSVNQGLLAMWLLGHIESLALALVVNPLTATERDQYNSQERGIRTTQAEADALQRNLAIKLWRCELANAGITAGTVAATAGVAFGFLGGAPLFITLALLQVARACTMNFQLAYTNALKAFIRDDEQRDAVMRTKQYYFNSIEQGYGRVVLMSTTIGLVQAGIGALEASYTLPAVAATLIGSAVVTAAGKLPLLELLEDRMDAFCFWRTPAEPQATPALA